VTLQLINPKACPFPPSTYTHVVVGDRNQDGVHRRPGTRGCLTATSSVPVTWPPSPPGIRQTSAAPSTAAGADPGQVAKITIYVVHHRPERLPDIEQARKHLFGEHKPADTVVGVETLAQPGYLIEVDAIAVTDR